MSTTQMVSINKERNLYVGDQTFTVQEGFTEVFLHAGNESRQLGELDNIPLSTLHSVEEDTSPAAINSNVTQPVVQITEKPNPDKLFVRNNGLKVQNTVLLVILFISLFTKVW